MVPTEWKHPMTGETLLVYERTNQERDGVKSQLFAMNEEKTGLGRVYDSRTEFGVRTFSGGLKFPLGYWKQGETKQVVETRYEGSQDREPNRVDYRSSNWISFIRDHLIAWSSSGFIKNHGGQKSSTIRRILIAPTKAW